MKNQSLFVTQVKSALCDGIKDVQWIIAKVKMKWVSELTAQPSLLKKLMPNTLIILRTVLICCLFTTVWRKSFCLLDLDLEINHGKSILITGNAGNCNTFTEGFDSSEELSFTSLAGKLNHCKFFWPRTKTSNYVIKTNMSSTTDLPKCWQTRKLA